MPTESNYSDLLQIIPSNENQSVSEASIPYHFLRERHIQAMWLEQKYFRQLTTSDGSPITVLSPGIWNGEAGPDFLKAHLRIGDREVRGDVELHLSEEDWYHHHHHQDEKYNNVILHVGFWKPRNQKTLLTSNGAIIPCTHLEHLLTIPESRILKLIDLDLYPYKHFVGSGICANALFRSMPEQKAIQFFRKAADWRLTQKRKFLKAKIDDIDLHFPGGIAMTLGYKQNAEAFLQLFLYLKKQQFSEENTILATAMGICGFFSEKYRLKWINSQQYQALAAIYEAMSEKDALPLITLSLDKIRPANHPIRRIAVLAKLLSDATLSTLLPKLYALWNKHWQQAAKDGWKPFQQNLLDMLPSYRDPYWERHYSFEDTPQPPTIILISNDLKKEILINVFLPILHQEIKERNNPHEIKMFQDFYSSLPASKTKKATYLVHRFFGDTQKGRLLRQADTQQGAYQLHRDFCIHYEASCLGCPFVERFHSAFACTNSL